MLPNKPSTRTPEAERADLCLRGFAVKVRDVSDGIDTRQAVLRLASDRPDWLPVLRAACAQAQKSEAFGGQFAGTYVLKELERQTGERAWRPGLRLLAAYGLLEKVGESSRGGRRAYYRMPDRASVERALEEIQRAAP